MDELYKMLKAKLAEMSRKGQPTVKFTFEEVSRVYQLVCLMEQIREITVWCDKGYS